MYREIGGEDDSEAEEDDLAQLESIESRLLQYDPTFTDDDTLEGKVRVKNALLNAFVRGGTDGRYDSESMEQSYQIHLNVERIRVPETWFQPAMFGIDSAGLGEVAGWLMNGFEDDVRKRIMQVGGFYVRLNSPLTLAPGCCPHRRLNQASQPPPQDAQHAHTRASIPRTAQDSWSGGWG